MKTDKIVPIRDLWKRAQEESAASGEADESKIWPTFEPDDPELQTDESKSEVRFEKIIEVKERIKNNYYRGDRVGMDILRSIFSGDSSGEGDGKKPQSGGERDGAGDS